MVRIHGAWTPDINYNDVEEVLVLMLAIKPARLTGGELKFVRLHLELTLHQFANKFAISIEELTKCERNDAEPIDLNWPTEKDIRLHILAQKDVGPSVFVKAYESMETRKSARRRHVSIDHNKIKGRRRRELVSACL